MTAMTPRTPDPSGGPGPSRRTMLRALGGVAVGAASLGVLPIFGTPDRKQNPASCVTPDRSAIDHLLNVSNWPLYIDQPAKHDPSTMQRFEKQTGITVDYTEDINDNTEFFAKVVNQLGSCQPTNRDLFVLTDWMAARMIGMGWIQKLDAAKVPNVHANLIDSLHVDWDPKREYSAPWQSGFTGIAYNKKYTSPVHSIKELMTRPDLNGHTSMLTEMRDTMGLILLSLGYDPNKFDDNQWQNAMDALRKAAADKQVRRFTGNDYIQDLQAGNITACMAWSGDIANSGDKNLVFVTPEEGLMIWADNMLIPNMAAHKGNAEAWMNFYYEPEMAARLAGYNNYICPVKGAQEAMAKIDPANVHNQLIFPDAETLSHTHHFMALQEYQMRDYEGAFSDVTGV